MRFCGGRKAGWDGGREGGREVRGGGGGRKEDGILANLNKFIRD